MIRIVATADSHIGEDCSWLPPERAEQRRAALRRGFRSAVDCALDRRAQLFLQLGDLFDSPDPPNSEREFVAGELARLHGQGVSVWGIGGCHDTPRGRVHQPGVLPQAVYAQMGLMHLLGLRNRVDADVVVIDGRRITIGGLSWSPAWRPGDDPLAGVRLDDWPADAELGLLLFHCAVADETAPGGSGPMVELATLEALTRADHVLCGHTHGYAQVRLGERTLTRVGATERFGFDPGHADTGCAYLELDGATLVRAEHVRTPAQPRYDVLVATSELGPELATDIIARIDPDAAADAFVRLRLVGALSLDQYHRLDLRRVADYVNVRAFHFEFDATELQLDAGEVLGESGGRLSQSEELTASARELQRQAPDDDTRQLIAEALSLVLSHR